MEKKKKIVTEESGPEERRRSNRLWLIYGAVMAAAFILVLLLRPEIDFILFFLFANVVITLDIYCDYTNDLVVFGYKMAKGWLIAEIFGLLLCTVVFLFHELF